MLPCFSDCVHEQSDRYSYYDQRHPIAINLQPLESTTTQQEMYFPTEDVGSNRNTFTLLQEARGVEGTAGGDFRQRNIESALLVLAR